jgi:penicillin amidase
MGQTPTTQTPGDPPRRGAKQRGGDDGDDKHDLGHNHPGAVSHHANGKPAAVHGEPGYYLSTAWAGHGEGSGRAISVWLEVAKAGSALEAMDAARESPQPSLCWIVADRQGHIGMQASGWFPRRRAGNGGQVPVPAWNAKNHWQGWIDSRALPRVYDPPEGFVATANENINQPQGPQLVTLPVPDYRKRRIVERLLELPAATVRDMQELQYDVHSVQARELLEEFVPYLPDGPVKRRLAAWDCRYAPASREATLFAALYRNVLLEVFGHEEGIGWRRMLYLCSRFGYSTMVLSAADRVLVRSDSSWWRGRDKGELVRRAAQRLAHERDRTWAKTNAFHFSNRFFDLRVGRMLGLRTREMAMPGCHATPFQGHLLRTATREATFAPAYHFVADLGTDEAWSNLPGGPSESRFSRYYKSGISLWRRGRYRRLAPTAGRRR